MTDAVLIPEVKKGCEERPALGVAASEAVFTGNGGACWLTSKGQSMKWSQQALPSPQAQPSGRSCTSSMDLKRTRICLTASFLSQERALAAPPCTCLHTTVPRELPGSNEDKLLLRGAAAFQTISTDAVCFCSCGTRQVPSTLCPTEADVQVPLSFFGDISELLVVRLI